MKIIKIILNVLILSFNFNLLANQIDNFENPKVEVGIESIVKISETNYVISIYAINPYDLIAGVQFKFIPSDLFTIESVYGGRVEEKDFQIHFNKNGTVLGFSMTGNSLEPSKITSGISREKENIICYVNAISDNLDLESENSIDLEFVLASKDGKSLINKSIPFNIDQIQK